MSLRVFIGYECSGVVRRAFRALGHDAWSCDLKPGEDGSPYHFQGDVFETLEMLAARGWWPELAIFHPVCTFLTCAAEWAYGDGPYHQKVKPGTLVGSGRRAARDKAVAEVERLDALPIVRKAIENPRGVLSSRFRKPTQAVQPHWFGDDASKETCLWLTNLEPLTPTNPIPGRKVMWKGKLVERWANQTDSGQNRLSPSDDRATERSRTYPGFGGAMAALWGSERNNIGDLFSGVAA